ncbi:MAG: Ig-like domain-containing protein [Terriglobales bacterium]|jgi:hypothetical protein
MATERKSAGAKLPLIIALTVLLVAAFGAGCNGFFVPPTLTSLTINGNTTVEVGSTTTLTAFGLYGSTGNGNNLTSGVSWSTSDPTIAEITGACAAGECGSATIQGVASGTATITATSQSVTNTATLTVFLGSVTNYQVCMGTFGDTTTCSSGSGALAWNVNAQSEVDQNFIVQGTSNGTVYDLTTSSTWTVVGSPADIECDNTSSPAICTVDSGTPAGPYVITITYPAGSGSPTNSATINLTVTN